MARRLRFDIPGLLLHVMNRGLAHRTMFETRRDVRYFLALLALEVRAGRIEILAYAILTTHFHLLVRSRTGELHAVMQRVTSRYVRYFNRTRGRDGPLFRSRYLAKPVLSLRYRWRLIAYIDQNAPKARLASSGVAYAYGSARWYANTRRPPWLSTKWVDGAMGNPEPAERPAAYARTFGRALAPDEMHVIERRLESPTATTDLDAWDDLIDAAPPKVLTWMHERARLADGTKPGLAYVGASRIVEAVDAEARRAGDWPCRPAEGYATNGWPVLRAGLLWTLAGLTHAEIGRLEACGAKRASRRIDLHTRLLRENEAYAGRAAEIAAGCLGDRQIVQKVSE